MRMTLARRSALTTAAAVVLAAVAALMPGVAHAVPVTSDSLRGVRYVAYGHSFGQVQPGTGSVPGTLYPSLVRDSLGTDPAAWSNQTISGASTAQILSRARNTWKRGDYGLVTYLGNQNDVGRHVPAATFQANVRGFIDWVRGTSPFPPTIVIVLDTTSTPAGYARYPVPPTDADVVRYNNALRKIVASYPQDGTVVLADAFTGWDKATMISPDGQHPNDAGQAHIAAAITTALASTPFREGQNVLTPAPSVSYDSFNRPNQTTGLGKDLHGRSYSTVGGVKYGISNGTAYRASGGAARESAATVETRKADVDVSLTMTALSSKGAGPVWRLSNSKNYYALDVHGSGKGNAKVYKRVNGRFTQIGKALSSEVKPGSTVRVRADSTKIKIYVNGSIAYSGQDAFNTSATRDGIRIVDAGRARIDDLIIR
ncbi:SGNH/GDSL hydrolase family protein [Curtobacterium sp. A7_M15]|uniref:SGNH/GDSL hydrolase family protein n=1 Tax=Curtobacterium sp. A7_M15 TaxID=3065241 RepID=UPI002737D651|nr:SGNH/GDSL hydrolase family protein [Curtobacterium sp. A7_M15]MDP4331965.1 SGNH/GDSL hydrolase family protein [Curtobacterium sp. A7_M15]